MNYGRENRSRHQKIQELFRVMLVASSNVILHVKVQTSMPTSDKSRESFYNMSFVWVGDEISNKKFYIVYTVVDHEDGKSQLSLQWPYLVVSYKLW